MLQFERLRRGFRFGSFALDRETRELYRNGELLKQLRPQVFNVLVSLLECFPRALTREELIALVWGKGHREPEDGLKKITAWLRADLSDSALRPQYIEVLPRLGIQLIASVEKLEMAAFDVADSEANLTKNILAYLCALVNSTATLPSYYPAHLTYAPPGLTGFDHIRQTVRVAENYRDFENWLAKSATIPLASAKVDRLAYKPRRARLDQEDDVSQQGNEGGQEPQPGPMPEVIEWDERTSQRFHRAVILGDPGFGKTWLLRYEARRLAKEALQALENRSVRLDQLVFPIFLRLSELAEKTNEIDEALADMLSAAYSRGFRTWVLEKLQTTNCVIFLDAWDEVPTETPKEGRVIHEAGFREHLGRRLEAFALKFPRPRIVLASRLAGYVGSPIPGAQELELLAFENSQQEAFVRAWFANETSDGFLEALWQNQQVRGLGRIPLMLSLMCRAHQETRLTPPARRGELLGYCLRGLLRDWLGEKQRRQISDAYVDAQLELIEAVAYDLFSGGYEQFGEALLRAKMKPRLDKLEHTHELYGRTSTSLITELKNDGILTTVAEQGDPKLIFLHRTLHEYLAAGGWARELHVYSAQQWEDLNRKAWDAQWEPVIIYLAGRFGDSVAKSGSNDEDGTFGLDGLKRLLRLLVEEAKDDYFRHRLALAVECLPEVCLKARSRLSQEIDNITEEAILVWFRYAKQKTEQTLGHLTRSLPQLASVKGLVNGKPPAEWALPLLQSPRDAERNAAIQAVGHLGSAIATSEIVSALNSLRYSDNFQTRQLVLQVTAKIEIEKPSGADQLMGLLHDLVEFSDSAASEIFTKFRSQVAKPKFLRLLTNTLGHRQISSCKVLRHLGVAASHSLVLEALGRLLARPERVAKAAVKGREIKLRFHGAERDLVEEEFEEGYYKFYVALIKALGHMGPAAATQDIVRCLIEILEDERRSVEAVVGWMLNGRTKASKQEISDFCALFHQEHKELIETAADTLERIS